jgi:uncharacterized metal-binding protein YceD (DUF177 family)
MCDDENKCRSARVFAYAVKELADGPKQVDREIPLRWLAAELAACEYPVEPISALVSVTLEASSGGVLVRGRARVRADVECGICLAKTALDLDPEIGAFLMPRPDGLEEDDDLELTPEELDREWYVGDRVVLDELIRDGIMLELPMTPRCAGPCADPVGVVTEPTQPTVDPRLAPLASIKLSKE